MIANAVSLGIYELSEVMREMPADDDWLHASEAVRLLNLKRDERHRQYRAGHWLTRVALSVHFGGSPREFELVDRRGLPPVVLSHRDESAVHHLSISHSGGWIAVAVSGEKIGIDIEQRPREHALIQVESLLLADGEHPGSVGADGLLMRWVAKEAVIKRDSGEALPGSLRAMRLLPATPDASDVEVHGMPGYFFALAAKGRGPLHWLTPSPERVECRWCVGR